MPLMPMAGQPPGGLMPPSPDMGGGLMAPPPMAPPPPAGAAAMALAPLAAQQEQERAAMEQQQAMQTLQAALQAMAGMPNPAAQAAQTEPGPIVTPPSGAALDPNQTGGGYA